MKHEKPLLKLLSENSRRTISDLANQLGVSRSTVQQTMQRLERRGVIQHYTIKINPHYEQSRVSAYMMISIVAKKTVEIVRQIQKNPQVNMLCTISGQYDLIAMVTEETTEALDKSIGFIEQIDGVEKTLSHIVLSRKINNRW